MTPKGPEFDYVENPSIELLSQLGWTPVDAFHEILGVKGTLGRDSQHDVILAHRLRLAMRRINPMDVPDASINEAIELAKSFNGDKSGRFVNGVLDRIHRDQGRPSRTTLTAVAGRTISPPETKGHEDSPA